MKATIEFNLDDPEEKRAHLRCIRALDMACLLWDIEQVRIRYINGKIDRDDSLIKIFDALEESNLDIEELLA